MNQTKLNYIEEERLIEEAIDEFIYKNYDEPLNEYHLALELSEYEE